MPQTSPINWTFITIFITIIISIFFLLIETNITTINELNPLNTNNASWTW